jgi:quinolinate synthase
MGIVAHYYMDVELQAVLTAVQRSTPELQSRIGIADSLKMGDMAVDMCENHGVQAVVCLGVDFMSESVQAIMDRNGHGSVPVYRATPQAIGCSLAESAERDSYRAWLESSKKGEEALHVVYINTSLETKAISTSLVPTITCTSSNVLQTMLQASAQVGPDLKILYGPDTYMGENLQTLFDVVIESWDDERIARDLHPSHSRATLKQLRSKLDVFPSGNCVVHHMFGNQVVDTVKNHYDDAYVTAHLEVPGEMFQIAMSKSLDDRGVVGSTADILRFISGKVDEAAKRGGTQERLKFILGTEAGMVTSIVKSVQDILERTGSDVEAEIIFPVSSEAVMAVDDGDLAVVPGVAGGEGCSTAGGCATCPFMKMNNLDTLQDIVDMVEGGESDLILKSHLPPDRLRGRSINGVPAMELGVESIMHMREFMLNKAMPEELVEKVRNGAKS